MIPHTFFHQKLCRMCSLQISSTGVSPHVMLLLIFRVIVTLITPLLSVHVCHGGNNLGQLPRHSHGGLNLYDYENNCREVSWAVKGRGPWQTMLSTIMFSASAQWDLEMVPVHHLSLWMEVCSRPCICLRVCTWIVCWKCYLSILHAGIPKD